MDELLLAPVFLAVSFAYSSVGLGGGSSYTALMAIFGVGYLAIPTVSLVLNLLVTSVGSLNFIRRGHARPGLILPFLLSSMPMAYVGGSLRVPKEMFYWILMVSLIAIAIRIYLFEDTSIRLDLGPKGRLALSAASGSVLGLLAGIVGIGGGIYLVPLIIILGLGTQKEAAACGAIFVWVNSLAGLAARLQHNPVALAGFLPLMAAVLVGGALGSHMGSSRFSPRTMERILGLIIIAAIVFLSRHVF